MLAVKQLAAFEAWARERHSSLSLRSMMDGDTRNPGYSAQYFHENLRSSVPAPIRGVGGVGDF
jgi:hypothetical protein